MFLKSLIIKKHHHEIRHINFHKGLNLIVDNTLVNTQSSGNNVGKTTVLKLIDYCLGSSGENIYKDGESKDANQIEGFLCQEDVLIILELVDSDSNVLTVKRNFLKRSNKIQEINGINYPNDDKFTKKLQELIFGTDIEKPTFRQIISKNIRYEKNRLTNVFKVLHNNTTYEEYESLFFFWFGIKLDVSADKQRLQEKLTTEKHLMKRLNQDISESQIKQSLIVINRDITELEILKSNFNINDEYAADINNLNLIKSEINHISTKIGQLEYRKQLTLESKNTLEAEKANINVTEIRKFYDSASRLVPTVQKKFEEFLLFHNSMIDNKIKYIIEDLPNLEKVLNALHEELTSLLEKEKSLTSTVQKFGALEELEIIIGKLNRKYEQKGAYEEQLRQIQEASNNIDEFEEKLGKINKDIDEQEDKLFDKISEFNKFFTKISEQLYGEQFILSAKKLERAFTLVISGLEGNLGTGKKKGQIAAFDFAYIQFCDANNIKCLHFILHDQLETIHDNQLNILSQIANSTNSQYVVPIIKDKLPPAINIDEYTVLSLSQNDKLFKLT